jgi:hypothetical protein
MRVVQMKPMCCRKRWKSGRLRIKICAYTLWFRWRLIIKLPLIFNLFCTQWLKSHATRIKILTDGCNSVQFDWINKHTVSLWLYNSPRRSRHVVKFTCPSGRFSSNIRSKRMSFSHMNQLHIVEHYLTSRSYSTRRIDFRLHFQNLPCETNRLSLVWLTVSVTQEIFTGLHQTWEKQWKHASLNTVDSSIT